MEQRNVLRQVMELRSAAAATEAQTCRRFPRLTLMLILILFPASRRYLLIFEFLLPALKPVVSNLL